VAVATGGGFDDEAFNQLRDSCKDVQGVRAVPWLRPDMGKFKDMPPPDNVKIYGLAAAEGKEDVE
ncbi:hypothetical protein K469DRAFT_609185, partial [Zopfia rhizophila CBS 207.26]